MTLTEITLIVAVASFLFSCGILFWILRTNTRLARFFAGKKAIDLEESFILLLTEIQEIKQTRDRLRTEMDEARALLKKSIRHVEAVRFNPFSESGSNQSFAVSFLDEDGDGVVLSSIYSRERTSIFAKPIKNNDSEYELTEEEQRVIKKPSTHQ